MAVEELRYLGLCQVHISDGAGEVDIESLVGLIIPNIGEETPHNFLL